MSDIPDHIRMRSSLDRRPLNNHGICLLELCKNTELVILNGRIGEDKGIGRYTSFNNKSNGVLDYMLTSPSLLKNIEWFKIHDPFPESDHAPLELRFNCEYDNLKMLILFLNIVS